MTGPRRTSLLIGGSTTSTDDVVAAARFESMRSRADELVPNSDTPFWHDNTQFFEKARSGDWRSLVGEQSPPRYEAALGALTSDAALRGWLHTGWLG